MINRVRPDAPQNFQFIRPGLKPVVPQRAGEASTAQQQIDTRELLIREARSKEGELIRLNDLFSSNEIRMSQLSPDTKEFQDLASRNEDIEKTIQSLEAELAQLPQALRTPQEALNTRDLQRQQIIGINQEIRKNNEAIAEKRNMLGAMEKGSAAFNNTQQELAQLVSEKEQLAQKIEAIQLDIANGVDPRQAALNAGAKTDRLEPASMEQLQKQMLDIQRKITSGAVPPKEQAAMVQQFQRLATQLDEAKAKQALEQSTLNASAENLRATHMQPTSAPAVKTSTIAFVDDLLPVKKNYSSHHLELARHELIPYEKEVELATNALTRRENQISTLENILNEKQTAYDGTSNANVQENLMVEIQHQKLLLDTEKFEHANDLKRLENAKLAHEDKKTQLELDYWQGQDERMQRGGKIAKTETPPEMFRELNHAIRFESDFFTTIKSEIESALSRPGLMPDVVTEMQRDLSDTQKTLTVLSKAQRKVRVSETRYDARTNDTLPKGFDEALYLQNNQDVVEAIARGEIGSALEHYQIYGAAEGRLPAAAFDEAYYLDANPDVEAAVKRGEFSSGMDHFLKFGKTEGRNPHPAYDEGAYLAENLDVAAAIERGEYKSGIEHWLMSGYAENRKTWNTPY